MKIRCHELSCRNVIDMTQGFIKVDNRIFCSNGCCTAYIDQTKRFKITSDPFNEQVLNYKPKELWRR